VIPFVYIMCSLFFELRTAFSLKLFVTFSGFYILTMTPTHWKQFLIISISLL